MQLIFYLIHLRDAYEINLGVTGFSIVRYPNCHDSRGIAVAFDDLPPSLQTEILHRIAHYDWPDDSCPE